MRKRQLIQVCHLYQVTTFEPIRNEKNIISKESVSNNIVARKRRIDARQLSVQDSRAHTLLPFKPGDGLHHQRSLEPTLNKVK